MTAGGVVPALFLRTEEQTPAQIIETEARLLVAKAEALGVHVTIERQSVKPLAMRNHVAVVTVWEAR